MNDPFRPPDIIAKEKADGRLHLDWRMRIYIKQMELGGYFLARAAGYRDLVAASVRLGVARA